MLKKQKIGICFTDFNDSRYNGAAMSSLMSYCVHYKYKSQCHVFRTNDFLNQKIRVVS